MKGQFFNIKLKKGLGEASLEVGGARGSTHAFLKEDSHVKKVHTSANE